MAKRSKPRLRQALRNIYRQLVLRPQLRREISLQPEDPLLVDYLLYPRESNRVLVVVQDTFEGSFLVIQKQTTIAQGNLDLEYHVSTISYVRFEPSTGIRSSRAPKGRWNDGNGVNVVGSSVCVRRRHDEEVVFLIEWLATLFVFFPIRSFG